MEVSVYDRKRWRRCFCTAVSDIFGNARSADNDYGVFYRKSGKKESGAGIPKVGTFRK